MAAYSQHLITSLTRHLQAIIQYEDTLQLLTVIQTKNKHDKSTIKARKGYITAEQPRLPALLAWNVGQPGLIILELTLYRLITHEKDQIIRLFIILGELSALE